MINKNKLAVSLAVVAVVAGTGGTSAFAEKSIPGDLLYGVKVSINEPVAGIFAFSREEKTEWKERLIERRLKEAQKLVSGDNLDEETRLTLESKIKSYIDDFNFSAKELASEKGQLDHSSDLNIRLQASLEAYKDVIQSLSGESSMNIGTKNETEKLLATLENSIDKVRNDHDNLNTNKSGKQENSANTSIDATSTLEDQNTAIKLLNSTKLSYQKEKVNLSENIQTQINNKLALAETFLQEGKAFIDTNDYVKANAKFQLVIDGVNGAKLLMLSNVIRRDIDDDEDDIDEDDIFETHKENDILDSEDDEFEDEED